MRPRTGGGTNRVQTLLAKLQAEERVEDLESELERLDRDGLSAAEQEMWWEYYGIAAFRAQRDGDALRRFEEAHARFPSSPTISFSLGQQYERAREIDNAFALFARVHFPQIPAAHAMTKARYAYLWDRYEEGRNDLRPILQAYRKLGILDDTFVFMRGLPMFSEWWETLAAFSALTGDWREIEEATRAVSSHCSDYDFDSLRTDLEIYRSDDLVARARGMEQLLAKWPEGQFPSGVTRLRLAVARARLAAGRQEAENVLNAVELSPQDFPWLPDMRLLARGEIEFRFGSPQVEARLHTDFLRRQPLLFEPNLALSFHLLAYQERLKPLYRGTGMMR